MELLAPAGNRDAFIAAVNCGADAVYLGFTAFGARSYAGNFDESGLKEAVAYAHERSRKVYVTVNTLIKQSELDDVADVLELVCRAQADAVLLQDMGAVRIAQARFPDLPLHASTQMTVNNAQGAELLRRMGFTRVVPARECDLAELRRIADTGVEVEAFAHGALCVCVSGQCLFSSMIGGRSGNRGRCAQPCRMRYSLENSQSGYLLSTKDLMLLDDLAALQEAGVCSIKLEGRMKRAEYVAAVTTAYRQALDALEAKTPYHPDEKTLQDLRQVFNRGGFTKGYVRGQNHAKLMSWEKPSHQGVRMGVIERVQGSLARMHPELDLNDGDGLQLRGHEDTDFVYSGKDTVAGMEAVLRLPESCRARRGDAVYRLTDARQMKELRRRIDGECDPIEVDAVLRMIPDEKAELTVSDSDGHTACAWSEEPVEKAESRPIDADTARSRIAKMGGTPYLLRGFDLIGNGFLPVGQLNALRRKALADLRMERIARPERRILPPFKDETEIKSTEGERKLIVCSENVKEAAKLLDDGADVFLWRLSSIIIEDLAEQLSLCTAERVAVELPAVTYTEQLEELHAFITEHQSRFLAVTVNNIGQLAHPWPCEVWGGQGLNMMNSESAAFYERLGVSRRMISCESTAAEMRDAAQSGGEYITMAYGRVQLMLLSHCPNRTMRGDGQTDNQCSACDRKGAKPGVYTDRMGYRFPLRRIRTDKGCLLRLYNSVPTDMAKNSRILAKLPYSLQLDFTDETSDVQHEIVQSYRLLMDEGSLTHTPAASSTSGHLTRGVE